MKKLSPLEEVRLTLKTVIRCNAARKLYFLNPCVRTRIRSLAEEIKYYKLMFKLTKLNLYKESLNELETALIYFTMFEEDLKEHKNEKSNGVRT